MNDINMILEINYDKKLPVVGERVGLNVGSTRTRNNINMNIRNKL